MIELIKIDQGFEPIEFDQELAVDLVQISDRCVNRAKVQPNEFTNRHPDHPMISLPITLLPDDHSMAGTKSCANIELLSNYYQQYLLEQHAKDKLNDIAAARKGDKRLKYGILTLKQYNNQAEYLLPNMKEGPAMFDQEYPCDVHSTQISANLPMEKRGVCRPSSEEVAKIVEVICDVKDDNDQFSKVQVTKASRNTKLRAKDIDRVINYLSEVLKCLMLIEVIKPTTGRPPSPKYQILYGKTEYFPKRNKDEVLDVGIQNKVN